MQVTQQKIHHPPTLSGLLKVFGGSIEHRPDSVKIIFGSTEKTFNGDGLAILRCLESISSEELKTVPSGSNLYTTPTAGLSYDEVKQFWSTYEITNTIRKQSSYEKLVEAFDNDWPYEDLMVAASGLKKSQIRFLEGLSYELEGEWFVLTSGHASLKSVILEFKTFLNTAKTCVKGSNKIPAPTSQAGSVSIRGPGVTTVIDMGRSGPDQKRAFLHGKPKGALHDRAWANIVRMASDGTTYKKLVEATQLMEITHLQLDQILCASIDKFVWSSVSSDDAQITLKKIGVY